MYTKFEIVLLFLLCRNITEVLEVTEALKYLMDFNHDFEHKDRIRRLANKKIVTLTAANK